MPKSFLWENSSGTINLNLEYKWYYIFPKVISRNVNVIALLEFKFTCNDVTVEHYRTSTPLKESI